MDSARRVYLRYAFSRDPKVVEKAFEKMRGALKHLESAKGELTDTPNFHAYTQAIDAFRDVKYFLEHIGVNIEHEVPALLVLNHNPFDPAGAVETHKNVFKDALAEVGHLEADFGKAQKGKEPKSAA